MKVKCGSIYNAMQIINELAEKPMKVKLAAKFMRLINDLQKENEYIEKQRRDIIFKYSIKDENNEPIIDDNGNVTFIPEDASKLQEELKELSDFEVNIEDRNITEEEIENSNIELTIKQVMTLKDFFHKEEKQEENIEILE